MEPTSGSGLPSNLVPRESNNNSPTTTSSAPTTGSRPESSTGTGGSSGRSSRLRRSQQQGGVASETTSTPSSGRPSPILQAQPSTGPGDATSTDVASTSTGRRSRTAITGVTSAKRAEQNRQAQRSFRQRKDAYVKGLQEQVRSALELAETLKQENTQLKQIASELVQSRRSSVSGGMQSGNASALLGPLNPTQVFSAVGGFPAQATVSTNQPPPPTMEETTRILQGILAATQSHVPPPGMTAHDPAGMYGAAGGDPNNPFQPLYGFAPPPPLHLQPMPSFPTVHGQPGPAQVMMFPQPLPRAQQSLAQHLQESSQQLQQQSQMPPPTSSHANISSGSETTHVMEKAASSRSFSTGIGSNPKSTPSGSSGFSAGSLAAPHHSPSRVSFSENTTEQSLQQGFHPIGGGSPNSPDKKRRKPRRMSDPDPASRRTSLLPNLGHVILTSPSGLVESVHPSLPSIEYTSTSATSGLPSLSSNNYSSESYVENFQQQQPFPYQQAAFSREETHPPASTAVDAEEEGSTLGSTEALFRSAMHWGSQETSTSFVPSVEAPSSLRQTPIHSRRPSLGNPGLLPSAMKPSSRRPSVTNAPATLTIPSSSVPPSLLASAIASVGSSNTNTLLVSREHILERIREATAKEKARLTQSEVQKCSDFEDRFVNSLVELMAMQTTPGSASATLKQHILTNLDSAVRKRDYLTRMISVACSELDRAIALLASKIETSNQNLYEASMAPTPSPGGASPTGGASPMPGVVTESSPAANTTGPSTYITRP